MIGSGKRIPDKDATDIGLPARQFLSSESSFVILIDDLEATRSKEIQQVFGRYRLALNDMLEPNQIRRASVHFLVNMLEAYYFADAQAVNSVLGTEIEDYEGDVETIRNPKSNLKKQRCYQTSSSRLGSARAGRIEPNASRFCRPEVVRLLAQVVAEDVFSAGFPVRPATATPAGADCPEGPHGVEGEPHTASDGKAIRHALRIPGRSC